MTDDIANEIMIASHLLHTNNLSRIAEATGHRPILVINAMYAAKRSGKFDYNKKTDTIKISEDVEFDSLSVTEGMREFADVIEEYITNLNAEEKDVSTDELRMVLGMPPEFQLDLAVFAAKKLATYTHADPKDKKSVYTFVTLRENLDKKFGLKQFKKA